VHLVLVLTNSIAQHIPRLKVHLLDAVLFGSVDCHSQVDFSESLSKDCDVKLSPFCGVGRVADPALSACVRALIAGLAFEGWVGFCLGSQQHCLTGEGGGEDDDVGNVGIVRKGKSIVCICLLGEIFLGELALPQIADMIFPLDLQRVLPVGHH
jgi:hypothetical protein